MNHLTPAAPAPLPGAATPIIDSPTRVVAARILLAQRFGYTLQDAGGYAESRDIGEMCAHCLLSLPARHRCRALSTHDGPRALPRLVTALWTVYVHWLALHVTAHRATWSGWTPAVVSWQGLGPYPAQVRHRGASGPQVRMSALAVGDVAHDWISTADPDLPRLIMSGDQVTLSTGAGHHETIAYPADRDGMFRLGAGLIAWQLDAHADPRQPATSHGQSDLAELEHLIADAVAHISPGTAKASAAERPQ